jgi:hypothetical protein
MTRVVATGGGGARRRGARPEEEACVARGDETQSPVRAGRVGPPVNSRKGIERRGTAWGNCP